MEVHISTFFQNQQRMYKLYLATTKSSFLFRTSPHILAHNQIYNFVSLLYEMHRLIFSGAEIAFLLIIQRQGIDEYLPSSLVYLKEGIVLLRITDCGCFLRKYDIRCVSENLQVIQTHSRLLIKGTNLSSVSKADLHEISKRKLQLIFLA